MQTRAETESAGPRPSRRLLLAAVGLGIGAGAGTLVREGGRHGGTYLRPPGAAADFLATCLRCGLCAEACPVDAIAMAGVAAGTSYATPTIDAREAPCRLCAGFDELRCTAVCPSTALSAPASRREVRMGVARIDTDRCLAWLGVVCRACWHACPYPGEALALDERTRPSVVEEVCVGCGICVHACLTEESSIQVTPAS